MGPATGVSPPSRGCRPAGLRPRSCTRRSTSSWLNQIEIYFSIVQRKVLTPNDFRSFTAVKDRLRQFQAHYEDTASPFQWTFTRRDLHRLLAKLAHRPRTLAA